MAAKQRVARLQRDLLRVRSDEALRTLQARNRELVSSMRAEATLRRMRPTTSDMLADGVEAADEADVVNVASQLFSRMQQMQPGEQPRSMLFRLLGENHSGRVDYSGFENLVRRELGLNTKAIPKSRLQAVWAALDTQLRGSISEGDLGRFMRRGEPQDEGPQQRLLKARQGTARELRAELDAMFHRDVRREMRDKPRASDEELAQLSALLNAHTTHDQRAQRTTCWYRMFKAIDFDKTGLIDYDEFCVMVRRRLEVSTQALSEEQMRAAWLTLDANGSGHIDAGEFCSFLRRGQGGSPPRPIHERRRELARRLRADADADEDHWARTQMRSLDEAARRADGLANDLERELRRYPPLPPRPKTTSPTKLSPAKTKRGAEVVPVAAEAPAMPDADAGAGAGAGADADADAEQAGEDAAGAGLGATRSDWGATEEEATEAAVSAEEAAEAAASAQPVEPDEPVATEPPAEAVDPLLAEPEQVAAD